MKAYKVDYSTPSSFNCDEKVIAEKEEDLESILTEKNSGRKIIIKRFKEISLEEARLKELSAGDLLRLIK